MNSPYITPNLTQNTPTLMSTMFQSFTERLAEPTAGFSADNNDYRVTNDPRRNNLIPFTTHTFPIYKADPVHELVASYLERVYSGEIKRLIINAPPQIGKSELTGVRFPAFWLGNRPNDSIIMASYGQTRAEFNSKQVRNLIASPEYSELFPNVKLDPKSQAADMWALETPHRGGMKAAGIGGALTGFGAELAIIDDPVKDWADGQSQTILRTAIEWYKGTFRTRVRENGAIVIIMTRWNIGDLTGYLLEQGGWTLLRLSALAEPDEERQRNNKFLKQDEFAPDPLGRIAGESIAPQRFGSETLEETRVEVGEVIWQGEYVQVPRAAEGGLFKRDKFNIIDTEPANIVRKVRFWDLALSEKESADYTVGVLMGICSDRRIVVLDVRRYRVEWDEAEPKLADQMVFDTAAVHQGVEGVFYQSRAVKKLLQRAELHNHSIRSIPTDKDKYTRALPFAARVGEGLVDVMRRGWTDTYIEELCAFNNGANDDQVDATSGAWAMLDSNQVHMAKVGRYA